MEEEQTSLKTLVTDTYVSLNQVTSIGEIGSDHLNLKKVRMVPPHFLPFNTKIGGQTRYIKDKTAICLTGNQARHIYKKVDSGSIINIDIVKKDLEQDIDKIDDTSSKINPYHKIIVNKAERDNTIISQMEQWLILSNVVNYVQYNRHPKNFCNLDIRAVDKKRYKKLYNLYNKEEERQILELDFGDTPEKSKGEYLDICVREYRWR